MREQRGNGLRRKILAGRLQPQKVFGKGNDVLRTLSQRGNAQLELTEAVKKILAEAAISHRGFEILVGGGDNAYINFDFAMAAETVEGLAIEHAQQFHLSLQLQFADFVEKKRALVGHFEQPGLGGVGAAESAFFVSEKLALDEIFGKRRAVDVDPRTAAALRRLVNRAGDEFLAGPRLPRDQHRFRMARHAIDQGHELMHDRAGKNKECVVNLAGNHARRGRRLRRRRCLARGDVRLC